MDLIEDIFSCQTHQCVDFLTQQHSADITPLLHVLMSPTQNHLKSFHIGEGRKCAELSVKDTIKIVHPSHGIWHFIKYVPIFKCVHTIRYMHVQLAEVKF